MPSADLNGSTTISPAQTWKRVARRIRVPLGFAFAAFYIWRARPLWWSLIAGAAIASLGLAIRALASGHVKKNRELTTTGPYAYVRNPLYLGSIIIGIGFAIAARDVWVDIVLIVFFIAIYVPVIRGEQAYLREHFSGYAEYARRVSGLVPRTLRWRGLAQGFSRELYLRHREYNALLGATAMLIVLVAKIFWFAGSR
jgi:protein-S-isoprenylcysteine O-methyltransferase Ste14